MGISYQGRDVQKQSEVGLRLEDLVSYDYSAYDSGSGEGAVEVVDRWLVADDFQYSSSIEFDKESLESYSASYFLPTVINISGAFYGIFSGSGASVSGPLTVIGTSSFYGPVNVSGALRLDPTEDPGNIEPSSSFLFQSASNTNLATDLYIRQGSQFIKFNWIADTLFTSLLYGGVVTYSGSTVYISSGSGIVVDHNANTVNESAATIKYVTWPNTSFTPTYINVRQVTYLAFDSSSNLIQDYEPFNSDDYVDKIILGAIGHFDLTNVTAFQGSALTAYAQQTQTNTFIDSFGPLKLTGYGITAQPSSFKLSVAAGTSFIHGGFYDYDPTRPSNISTVAQATASIAYVYRNGSGGIFFDTNGGAFYPNVTCSLYDDGTGTPASVSNNNWTIQRVTCDPRTGKLYIYYGQNIYATLDDALTNLPTDSFTEGDTKDFTTFLGYLVVKSNTSDLSNTTDNSILTSGLFRGIGGGGGGTGGGGAGTPGGSNTEIQYNNGGTFGGSPNFTFDGVSHVRVTGSLTVSGSSTFTNIGPAAFNGNTSMTGSLFVSSSNATQLQVGSNLLFVSSSGQVGIRNTVPNSDLEIYGVGSNNGTLRLTRGNNNANYVALSGGTSGAIYNINTSGVQDHIFQTGGTERMRISGSGNVGIGTSTPATALEVNGVIRTPQMSIGGLDSGRNQFLTYTSGPVYRMFSTLGQYASLGIGSLSVGSTYGGISGSANTVFIEGNTSIGTTTQSARLQVRGSGATSATTALRVENTNASASLVVLDDGSVGVGTSTITAKLDVRINQANASTVPYLNLLNDAAGYVGYTFKKVGSNDLGLYGNYTTPPAMLWKYVSTNEGYVGINTASPVASLHVSGSSGSVLLKIDSPASSSILYISGSGNVGVGTSTPTQKFTITAGSVLLDNTYALKIKNSTGTELDMITLNGGNSLYLGSGQREVFIRAGNNNILYVTSSAVGINTSTPSATLDVNGTARYVSQSYYGTFSESPTIYPSDTSINYAASAASLAFYLRNGAGGSGRFIFSSADKAGTTTSTQYLTQYTATYNPTSGTGLYTMIELNPTINQSGGANGITRGLHVNPTLPSALDFRAIENVRGNNLLNSTSGNTYIGLSTNAGTARLQVRGSGATSSTTALRVENSSTTPSLVVLDNGYVGIGTGSAAYKLDVLDNAGTYVAQFRGSNSSYIVSGDTSLTGESGLNARNSSGQMFLAISASIITLSGAGGANTVAIRPGGAERMRVNSSGNVLIGTTTDSGFRLDVSGSGRFTNNLSITGSLIASGTYGGINTITNKPNLFDINGIVRVQWTNGYLNNTAGDTTLDWELKQLNDAATTGVLDWENKILYDSAGASSMDWTNRTLSETTNTWVALEYSDDTYLNSQLYYRNTIPAQVQRSIANTPTSKYGGQVIQATVDAGVVDFQLVFLDTDGTWKSTKATVANGASKMLGICVDQAGGYILIEGDVGVSDDASQGAYVVGADHGLPVYVSSTTGVMDVTAPSGTGELVRIVGHIYYQSSSDPNWWTMKFRPSNDWYVL